jgi:hypothetical protein
MAAWNGCLAFVRIFVVLGVTGDDYLSVNSPAWHRDGMRCAFRFHAALDWGLSERKWLKRPTAFSDVVFIIIRWCISHAFFPFP